MKCSFPPDGSVFGCGNVCHIILPQQSVFAIPNPIDECNYMMYRMYGLYSNIVQPNFETSKMMIFLDYQV